MNWSTTPPTKPGFYAFKIHNEISFYSAYFDLTMIDDVKDKTNYEWLRLVPAEEVEKAWDEGFKDGQFGFVPNALTKAQKGYKWEESRAKQIAEGTL